MPRPFVHLSIVALMIAAGCASPSADRRTRALALTAASDYCESRDPMLALELATEAVRLDACAEAVSQLRQALALDLDSATFARAGSIGDIAAFSPDGRRVLTASFDGTVRVWDLNGERLQPTLQGRSAGSTSGTRLRDRSAGPDLSR